MAAVFEPFSSATEILCANEDMEGGAELDKQKEMFSVIFVWFSFLVNSGLWITL